jgi:hypothetical protein
MSAAPETLLGIIPTDTNIGDPGRVEIVKWVSHGIGSGFGSSLRLPDRCPPMDACCGPQTDLVRLGLSRGLVVSADFGSVPPSPYVVEQSLVSRVGF